MLKEQISADFMAAFKAKDMDKKNFLGLLKSEISKAETREDFNGNSEEAAMDAVKEMAKNIKKSGGDDAERELEYLKPYLPQLMERTEITSIVTEIISSQGLSGPQDIGKVMGGFNRDHKGKADNNIVKEVAMELL